MLLWLGICSQVGGILSWGNRHWRKLGTTGYRYGGEGAADDEDCLEGSESEGGLEARGPEAEGSTVPKNQYKHATFGCGWGVKFGKPTGNEEVVLVAQEDIFISLGDSGSIWL